MTITDEIHRPLREHAPRVDCRSLDDSPAVLHLGIVFDWLALYGGRMLAGIRSVEVESRKDLVEGKLGVAGLLLGLRYFDLIVALAYLLVYINIRSRFAQIRARCSCSLCCFVSIGSTT